MGFLDDLKGKKVYLDASVFIYAVDAYEKYLEVATEILLAIQEGHIKGVTSELSLTETLTHPKRDNNKSLERTYLQLLQSRPNFSLLPISRAHLIRAAEIRARSSAKTPDAIHVAAGESFDCDVFITNDKKWVGFTSSEILLLDDLVSIS